MKRAALSGLFISRRPRPATLAILLAFVFTFSLQAATEELPFLSRDEVIRSFGPPQSTLQRGSREILAYPDGSRVEIVEGRVLSIHQGQEPFVIDRDGARYTVGPGGQLQRWHPDGSPPPEAVEALTPTGDARPPESDPAPGEAPEADAKSGTISRDWHPFFHDAVSEEGEDLPPWAGPATILLSLLIRTAAVVLILRLTLGWMGEPAFYRDLIKVALLYTAVHDSVYALGGLGGLWQMIHIFRVAEIVSFFALATAIFRCGVASNGLTALKIAIGTKITAFCLMLGVGVLITFILLALV